MKQILIGLLCLIAGNTYAQIKDFNVTLDSRYDRIDEGAENIQNRVQGRIRIGFVYDVNGYFQLIGLTDTGPSYGNDWDTLHDLNNPNSKPEMALYFRNLYLQKVMGNTTLQAGSLGGLDSIGSAGVGSSGWVDGVSLNIKQGTSDMKVVVGSLYDSQNPSIFTRNRKLNFAEIEMSKQVFQNLLIKAGYEHFQDDFIKGKMKLDLDPLGKQVVSLVANLIYDVQEKAVNADLGASWDVLDTFTDGHKNYFKMDVYFSRLDPKMHFRNSLYSAYYQDGNSLVVKLSGKIDKKGKYNWYIRNSFGTKNRFDAGIAIKLD